MYVCNLNQIPRSYLYSVGVNESEKDALVLANEWRFGENMTEHDQTLLVHYMEIAMEINKNNGHIDPLFQRCSDLIIKAKWDKSPVKLFMDAWTDNTDYGKCCMITPHWPVYEFDIGWSETFNDKKKYKLQNGIQGLKAF